MSPKIECTNKKHEYTNQFSLILIEYPLRKYVNVARFQPMNYFRT